MTIADIQQNIRFIMLYDANGDGVITRDEVEETLRSQFAEADTDHDGRLSSAEAQEENDRRWRAEGTGSSPLIDWNQDGSIDFAEFSTTAHSVFGALDENEDGRLAGGELRPPRGRRAVAGLPPENAQDRPPR